MMRQAARLLSSSFRARTHLCGELGPEHVGQRVVLNGWLQRVREMGAELVFAPLRDHAGAAQLVWKTGVRGPFAPIMLEHFADVVRNR